MSAVFITPAGRVEGLYTEVLDLAALGTLTVRRATDIAFDNEAGQWRVRIFRRGSSDAKLR